LHSSSLLNTANVSSTYWKYANGLLTTLKSFCSWWPTKMFANAGPSGEPMATRRWRRHQFVDTCCCWSWIPQRKWPAELVKNLMQIMHITLWQCQKIQWHSWQLLLPTSCNRNHWCVQQVHCPLLELSRKETRWHFRWPQGVTVAPLAPVSGCGQREHHQHIGLHASLIWF